MNARLRFLLLSGVLCTSIASQAADQVRSTAEFEFLDPLVRESWESPEIIPFPLEAFGQLTPTGPISSAGTPVPLHFVMWAFADEKGKVRAQALTSHLISESDHELPMFRTTLEWEKTYIKGAPDDFAKFTINKNGLEVWSGAVNEPGFPFARITIDIDLIRPNLPDNDKRRWVNQLSANVSLTTNLLGGGDLSACSLPKIVEPFALWLCQYGQDRIAGFTALDSPLHAIVAEIREGPIGVMGVDTVPYHGTIDLSAVGIHEPYTVKYLLTAEAWSVGDENFSFAFIGDPLDVESGLSLDVTSPPASDDVRPGRLCDTQPDPLRFVAGRDGTVTDKLTGLMWQRCPAGFRVDDSGTPDDPGDDRCLTSSGSLATWQQALQAAGSDGTAGHSDWRLPNVKELASIAEPACVAPAIQSGPFPDTPSSPFWSSTPGRKAGTTMAVNFLAGDVLAASTVSQARSRLVRDAGDALLLPPVLSVVSPDPVTEGDSGTLDMVFVVVLDHPATSDVTFHFATADDTARAGEDYDAVSGTAKIHAGESSVEIRVPIRGDLVGEGNEGLFLVIDQVSSSARLGVAWATGTILDDEPALTVWPTDVYEGNSGNSTLLFTVSLNRSLPTDATFAFATADGTATAGTDYVPTSGTATIPAGQRTVSIPVSVIGDTVPEPDETVFLAISSPSSNTRIATGTAAGLIVDDETPLFSGLDDTGVHNCSNATQSGLRCPQLGFPGQDAEQGRDATFPSDVDGPSGFAFTKLDASGVPLPDQTVPFGTTPWSCIRDQVTGLWWEVKTKDGGLHDRNWTYTWFDSSGLGTGGDPGTANGGICVDLTSCDTEKFVAAVNAAGLCGHGDWRLPGRDELVSIFDGTRGTDALSADWFPNNSTTNSTWWTSTARGLQRGQTAGTPLSAWSFSSAGQGLALSRSRAQPGAVRLVRGPN